MKILLVEDEEMLNGITAKYLRAENMTVDTCFNGQQAIDYVNTSSYDVIVMDIMMPVLDGISALAQMRNEGNTTPVLLLTARDSVEDRVKGLDSGADDYLIKPFSFEELLARVRVLLRRNNSSSENADNTYTLANLTVIIDSHTVLRDNQKIKLSMREFSILEYMIRNKERVLSRESIEQHIWDYGYEGGTNVVDVYIRYLRKKIDNGYSPKLIHTIRGLGYVLKVEDD